ncbi:MAG: hypothetical protein JXN61_18495 [Sedimentisphaerales bacterium]|nr:hypothetical protein [Sedimentisphaerales bacterium]
MAGSSRKVPSSSAIMRWFAGSDADRDRGGVIRALVFFVLLYLYLWLYVDLRLIYHGGGVITNFPVFFRGRAFFEQFTLYPGGLVEYAGAFLAQLFYYSWAGALIVTLLAWSIGLCIDCFLKAADAPGLRGLRFVPAILLLVIYSRYTYRLASILALLTALLCVCLYLRATAGRKLSCMVVFGVLSAALYYVAGGGYLLFAAVCAIYEILLMRRWAMGILYLLSGAAVPYIGGVLIFRVSVIDAYSELLPFSWKIADRVTHEKMFDLVYAFYAFVLLIALGLGLRRTLFTNGTGPGERRGSRAERRTKAKHPGLIGRIRLSCASKGVFRGVVESLVLFAVAGGAVFASYDGKQRIEFEVSYYSSAQMWERLLRSARRHPGNHRVTNAVNRALYHTGRFGYDMFSYPQLAEGFLLTAEKFTVTHWDRFDVRIELGLVCMAENDLAECIGMFGWRPAILKGLALANLVKGNIGSARIYLGALGKTLFDAGWANQYLDRLESDPNLSTDKEIQRLRARVVEKDHSPVFSDNEQALLALLEKDKTNRMAFEYLMSWYMLTRQLDKFADNIKRLNDFGYSEVPRLYEEALFVYAYETGKSVALNGSWGRPKSGQRIEDFGRIFNSYGRNKEAAFAELAKNYGDSYFFYSVYGFSGVKN